MVRTTVTTDQQTMDRLKALALDRGVSLATIVREALEDKAKEYRPKPKSIGIFASGGSDIATTEAAERVPPRSWR
jgi:hypothetical protein